MKKKTTATKKKAATKLSSNWSSTPPDAVGYWWVRDKKKKSMPVLVEVERFGDGFNWSFLDGITWNRCKDYPKYQWAGPVLPPE